MNDMNEELIKNEIQKGIAQVDSSLVIDKFACTLDSQTRKASVYFTAKTESGETLDINTQWG